MSGSKKNTADTPRYPGIPEAMDGSSAIVAMETAASEAAGAYPITPSTQMGEGWAQAVASGVKNVNGRKLIFFEPEGEHAAAAVTAGMSMMGLRSTNFSSGQGIAYMHESLYAATGKRLTYVLNVAARAMTKQALNVHAGHDDYHAVDDTGFFQLFAKNVQNSADLNLIAHRIAELSLNPGIVAQDGFLTSHVIETLRLPEAELVREYLGDPSDIIESPTPAQRMVYGKTRRRIPELFDLDYPSMVGVVANQDSYAQGVAAQRPFYFDHLRELTDRAMAEYADLTGRVYARAMGYRMHDAEWVLLGQGSVVTNLEAVADHLRATRGLKVGVVDLVMFRPFPADLVTHMLGGTKGVTVFERVDQPLAADPPVLRELRTAMAQAVENGRRQSRKRGSGEGASLPHPRLAALSPDEVPDFYAAGFGFGSRDLQPGDVVAAVENMLPEGKQRKHFYLGIEFVDPATRFPKLQIWQEKLLDAYPDIGELALARVGDLDLMPEGSISIRIHSVGGWGAITMGKNLALTANELLGLHIKANPKYGSEKKGQPTTFYATLSKEVIKPNAELKHVDVVLSPDPNAFRNSDPLAGLSDGGAFVIQTDLSPEKLWESFPAVARRTIVERKIRVYGLDGFSIASAEASDADLRYRMQGAAFMGAFFRVAPLAEREGLSREEIFAGIETQLDRKFGKRGGTVVEDNMRVIGRGWDELVEVPAEVMERALGEDDPGAHSMPHIPRMMDHVADPGLGNPGRFWEQVCAYCAISGKDVIADPFAAVSAIPAATSAVRDMTAIRFEVPDFVAEKCTGCSQCWVQCPDAAIPGLVNTVEDVIDYAIDYAGNGQPLARAKQISKHLSRESRKILDGVPFTTFGEVVTQAYSNVVDKLGWDAERRRTLDEEWARVYPILADFPLAKTAPFYDLPERKEKGTGGLLAVTISPEACKGCNICVDVCPEDALITVKQDEEILEKLRRNWAFWEELPDTPDRYVNIADLEEGIGVLSSLLLKKDNYQTLAGGDGACMGCGEKTAVHLVVSTIEGLMQPRVAKLIEKLDALIADLDGKARAILAEGAELDLETVSRATTAGHLDLPLDDEQKVDLKRYADAIAALKDLKWRYEVGPGGMGRAPMGIANSTGCSSVWGSTYPYNPYPFPWVNHLFQDAPSIAIGIFEGQMRKMADNFVDIRRAELLAEGDYDPEAHEPFFADFDWQGFSDEEFDLCPPILAMGGDGAMLDIGFQNLSRLLASGKPLRVVVLDTQVYSNTGGQACTSGFTGQIADMSAFGKAQRGKQEVRKELALIALAHRGAYVLQTSQAHPSHMIEGMIKGLRSRRPAVFNLYTPCPVEHGLPDEWAPHAAKLALEARAFPFLRYDPDEGESIADCLTLEGNPDPEEDWPSYTLAFRNEEGEEVEEELPLTVADWAATEGRFAKQFMPLPEEPNGEPVLFHEYVAMDPQEREGKVPFVWTLNDDKSRRRITMTPEIVRLAEDRQHFWSQLRELAGLKAPAAVADAATREAEAAYEAELARVRRDFEARVAELRTQYPAVIARRLAEGLLAGGKGEKTVAELLEEAAAAPPIGTLQVDFGVGSSGGNGSGGGGGGGVSAGSPGTTEASGPEVATVEAPAEGQAPESGSAAAGSDTATGASAETAPEAAPTEDDDALVMEPYIDTVLCTSCNECIQINKKLFAYNDEKQAYIADPKAGSFKQIVQAAEKCPAGIIHPGDPLDPSEPDLEKWKKRAERFN